MRSLNLISRTAESNNSRMKWLVINSYIASWTYGKKTEAILIYCLVPNPCMKCRSRLTQPDSFALWLRVDRHNAGGSPPITWPLQCKKPSACKRTKITARSVTSISQFVFSTLTISEVQLIEGKGKEIVIQSTVICTAASKSRNRKEIVTCRPLNGALRWDSHKSQSAVDNKKYNPRQQKRSKRIS